jgi:pilus assembly protein CpaB
MQKQKIIILIIGVGLAFVSVAMVKAYIDQQQRLVKEQAKKAMAEEKANQAVVLLAKQDIPRGSPIYAEMMETAIVPKKFVQPQAIGTSDSVYGMVTVVPISKGEQVTISKLAYPKQAIGSSLSGNTPVGKRAITVSVDNIASLAGMIRPGDYVDIISILDLPAQSGVESKQKKNTTIVPLFQNVLVLAVGQETSAISIGDSRKKTDKKEASPFITLALTPQEANLIAFVQEQGKIRMFLRSPNDSQLQPTQPANWDTLFQYGIPKEPKPKPKREGPEASSYIEIFRGMNKDKIPVYK